MSAAVDDSLNTDTRGLTVKTHVIEVSEKGMAGRCDLCGAQAYVEVAMTATDLKFCAHHATAQWDYIMSLGVMVADHRPYLAKQDELARLPEEPAKAPK